jgi:hypothetical protein
MRDHQDKMAPCAAIHKARKRLLEYLEPEYSSACQYYDHYKSLLEVLRLLDAIPAPSAKSMELMERVATTVTDADGVVMVRSRAQLEKAAQDYKISGAFLYNADQKRYGSLVKGLENSYQLGHDEYPRNLQSAYSLLSGWQPEYEHSTGLTEGLVCTTQGQDNSSKPARKNKDHITCFS